MTDSPAEAVGAEQEALERIVRLASVEPRVLSAQTAAGLFAVLSEIRKTAEEALPPTPVQEA